MDARIFAPHNPISQFDVDHSDEPETEFHHSTCRLKFIEFVLEESSMISIIERLNNARHRRLALVRPCTRTSKTSNHGTGAIILRSKLSRANEYCQARIFRLFLCAETGNWQLAQYECVHVRKTFKCLWATKFYPVFGDVHQKKLIHEATRARAKHTRQGNRL